MISWECAVEVNQSTVSTFIMQVEGDRGEDRAGRTGEAENPASSQGFVVAAKSVQYKGFHKLRTREDLIRFNADLAKPEFFDMMASNSEIIHHFL